MPENVQAPVKQGEPAGHAKYFLNGTEIGCVDIIYDKDVEKAQFVDYLKKTFGFFLL